MRTVGRLLDDLAPPGSDGRREARLLLGHVRGIRNPISIDRASTVSPEEESRFGELWARRTRGEPVQYLLGEWDFFGRTFRVDSRALIPRPETEQLVEEALREEIGARRVLDLGCGSGVLAVTLAIEQPRATVVATDISLAALALTRENARRHGVAGRVLPLGSDWLRAIGGARFDLVLSNPPYVSTLDRDALPGSVRDFEPHAALFAGVDGLSEIRRLLEDLPRVLSPGAAALLEFGFGQSEAVAREIERRPAWRLERIVPDLAAIPRVAVLRAR